MLKSCEFGQLSNFMVLCILPSKSWVFHKTHFKGALSFWCLTVDMTFSIQLTDISMDPGDVVGFSDVSSVLLDLLTSTEKDLMGTLI